MARISPIVEEDHPELADLIARIKRQRARLNVYRVLLHSPTVASMWFDQNNAIRSETEVEGQLQELAIIRVAQLKGVNYLLQAHLPKIALAEGLSQAQCNAIEDWRDSHLFDERQRAVLAYVEAMTKRTKVPRRIFEALRTHFSERQVVEISVLIGAYIMNCHVLTALEVEAASP